MKNKKVLLIVAAIFLSLGVFFVGWKLYSHNKNLQIGSLSKEQIKTFVPEHAARMGANNAKVYLVEFLDPECESCRDFSPLVKSIMNEFEGKIQLVIRYAPFHQNSEFAIKILEAARKQNKFWETLDLLFQFQPEWGSHHAPRPELIWNYLPRLGLDLDLLKQEMENPSIKEIIEQDKKDAMTLGITGTPTFFVNGILLEEFGYGPLRELVAKELDKN